MDLVRTKTAQECLPDRVFFVFLTDSLIPALLGAELPQEYLFLYECLSSKVIFVYIKSFALKEL